MKTLNYGGKDLYIGSIAGTNEMIEDHMLAHFTMSETETNTDEWFQRFNSQVKEMSNFIELSKDKKTFMDIGSQFGSFSLSFIGNSEDKTAYAFDGGLNPFLTTTQIKLLNKLNNFHTFNFLIGNKNETVKCFSEELQSLSIPGPDSRLMLSIDMVSQLFNIEPDVIKIDIEGSEYDALLGAFTTIMEYRPTIFIEIHPTFLHMYGSTTADIVNFVKDINYRVLDLNQIEVEDYQDTLNKETSDSNRTIWVPNN